MKFNTLKLHHKITNSVGWISVIFLILFPEVIFGRIIGIPQDYDKIQDGINAAFNGDTVLISPGIYYENISFDGKAIILASWFYTTGKKGYIEETIIDGQGDNVIVVGSDADGTKIIGLTIQNGDKGIQFYSRVDTLNNYVHHTTDGISYESGSGVCKNNLIVNNRDDGIDIDGSSSAIIANNIIRDNNDDGIENRLHPYNGEILEIVIRQNLIANNKEDGIQLIDYPGVSDRCYVIERNKIINNEMVGIGIMPDGDSVEDFTGAPMPERVLLFNNSFVDNFYGVTGGINLIALNNIFAGTRKSALKNVSGDSIASYNMFWNNGTDNESSNIDSSNSYFENPMLNSNHSLTENSPAIDAGVVYFEWSGDVVLDLQDDSYLDLSVDVGAVEYGASIIEYAGFDQTVDEGQTVYLQRSQGCSGNILTSFQWHQINGKAVTLSDPNHEKPSFVAPPVDINGDVFIFEIVVKDESGKQNIETYIISIIDNGITGFPEEIYTFKSINNKPLGLSVSGGNITKLHVVDPDNTPEAVNKPQNLIYGLIDMEIKVNNPGGSATVSIYFPELIPEEYKWYKYSLKNGWYDFSEQSVINSERNQITLFFEDGLIGDDDGVINGMILDPSGLSTYPDSSVTSPNNEGSGGGCFLTTLSEYFPTTL